MTAALENRDPVVNNIRRHLKTEDVVFKEFAEKAQIPLTRFYSLMEGRGRLEVLEYASICQAAGKELSFFLGKNT